MATITGPFMAVYAVGKFAKWLISRQGKGGKFIFSKLGDYHKSMAPKSVEWREHWARVQYRKKLLEKIPKFLFMIGYEEQEEYEYPALEYIYERIIRRSCATFANFMDILYDWYYTTLNMPRSSHGWFFGLGEPTHLVKAVPVPGEERTPGYKKIPYRDKH